MRLRSSVAFFRKHHPRHQRDEPQEKGASARLGNRRAHHRLLQGRDGRHHHAHDKFLQAAVALGFPGLVAFLAIYLASAWSLLAVICRGTNSFRCAVALGVAVGLASHAVYGLTEAVLFGTKPSFVWWLLLGLGMAIFALEREADQCQFA